MQFTNTGRKTHFFNYLNKEMQSTGLYSAIFVIFSLINAYRGQYVRKVMVYKFEHFNTNIVFYWYSATFKLFYFRQFYTFINANHR